jgi:hypothetical protein
MTPCKINGSLMSNGCATFAPMVATFGLMTEFHDLEEEEDHGENEVDNHIGDKEQETIDLVDDGPARWKQCNYHGKKKLFNFQKIVDLKVG